MNLKHLFKTLVFSLLVVVFAACDEPQKQGEVSYTVKYDGKTVRENDVIVVTMDDFDATSIEMLAQIEIVNGEENWRGLRKILAQSDIEEKDEVKALEKFIGFPRYFARRSGR